jgi:hypothetical protein
MLQNVTARNVGGVYADIHRPVRTCRNIPAIFDSTDPASPYSPEGAQQISESGDHRIAGLAMFGSDVIQPGHITRQVQRPQRYAKAFRSGKARDFIALSWEEDPRKTLRIPSSCYHSGL